MFDDIERNEFQKYNVIYEIKNEINRTFASLKSLECEFRGKDIIYPQRFNDWQETVNTSVNGDFYGKELLFALDVMTLIENNRDNYKLAKEEFKNHEYFTFKEKDVLDIILNYSKYGPQFVLEVANKDYLVENAALIKYMQNYNIRCRDKAVPCASVPWEREVIVKSIKNRNDLMKEFAEWQKLTRPLIPDNKWKSWNEQMLIAVCAENPMSIRLTIKVMQELHKNINYKKITDLFNDIIPDNSIQYDIKDLLLNYAPEGPDFIEYYDGWQLTTEEFDLINTIRSRNIFDNDEFEDSFLDELDTCNYEQEVDCKMFGNIDELEM